MERRRRMTDVKRADQQKIMASMLLDEEPWKKDQKVEMISRLQVTSLYVGAELDCI